MPITRYVVFGAILNEDDAIFYSSLHSSFVESVLLSSNFLSGPIPSELGTLQNLGKLRSFDCVSGALNRVMADH